MSDTLEFLSEIAGRALPRILTQLCRDPDAPYYGCADRDWWHYKIRDFPSIILQQAGATLSVAAELPVGMQHAKPLKDLSRAACLFWDARAVRHGAFEEYYPFENGYPPLAFSTLAVASLCADGLVSPVEVKRGLGAAARQLLSRFEQQASNQQLAGAAALALLRRVQPDLVPDAAFERVLAKTLALQTSEGWFPEYDGPDLGYLSVAMDCLWDIHDQTHDERCLDAIESAFAYLSWFVLGPLRGAGMHNARNTDYMLPYGLARLAASALPSASRAEVVMAILYRRRSGQAHFFDAVDDRYWCHYTGRSVFRALKTLMEQRHTAPPPDVASIDLRSSMPLSGHALLHADVARAPSVLVSTRKGAIFTAVWPDGAMASDFGWTIKSGRTRFVSHWWSTAWATDIQPWTARCSGYLVSHRELESSPLKHTILRLAGFVLGARLVRFLKDLVIFKKHRSRLRFDRVVRVDGLDVVVEDRISGLESNDKLVRAPRASMRHVASADGFHEQDFALLKGAMLQEQIRKDGRTAVVVARYRRLME